MTEFFALHVRVTLTLLAQRNTPKEYTRHPTCLPFGFPAMLNRTGGFHIPNTPAQSARLGKPERDWKTFRREGAPPTTKLMHPLLTRFCGWRALAAYEGKEKQ